MAELRMRDLCARTGLSRQTIHFYVAQGLLEPPRKTGRTMGYYSEAHVERLQLIRRLQEEHFLPLPAIRAMLDDEHGGFSRAQRHVLAEVKQKLTAVAAASEEPPAEKLAAVLARCKLARRDADELAARGLLQVSGRGKSAEVSAEGAWLLELWGEVRAAGFTRERGFGPELLLLFERGIAQIFEEEKQILGRLAASLPGPEVAAMVDRALPLIHSFLVRAHQRRVRELFLSLGAPP
jgi:DNA-binding transcriptional MerR regulator